MVDYPAPDPDTPPRPPAWSSTGFLHASHVAARREQDPDSAVDESDATAWAVPYTDLTMLLMVFFIVMMSMAGTDLRSANTEPDSQSSPDAREPHVQSDQASGSASSQGNHIAARGQGILSADGANLPINSAAQPQGSGLLPDGSHVLPGGGTLTGSDRAHAADATDRPPPAHAAPRDAQPEDSATLEPNSFSSPFGLLPSSSRARSSLNPRPATQSVPPSQTEIFASEWVRRVAALETSARKFLDQHELTGLIEIDATPEGVILRLPEELLFTSASPDLQLQGTALVASVFPLLRDTPGHIQISGHTDDRPIHTARFPSNWELSSARAIAVVRVLRQMGLPENRLQAVGHGSNRPIATNATEKGRAKNRRVTIDISPRP